MNDNDLNLSLALQDFALGAEKADHKQLNTTLLLAMTRLRQLSDRLEIAEKWEAKMKFVLETHRNEDYVIGSVELAKATGAQVFHGPGLDWGYGSTISDTQEFSLGSLTVLALHTPGHSPESTCYVLLDSESGNQPVMVCTGDTLFVGDVGRTDFLGPEMTPIMSEKMYKSLFKKLLPLGDGVIVLPAHGARSVCGGKISEREISTVGIEKAKADGRKSI